MVNPNRSIELQHAKVWFTKHLLMEESGCLQGLMVYQFAIKNLILNFNLLLVVLFQYDRENRTASGFLLWSSNLSNATPRFVSLIILCVGSLCIVLGLMWFFVFFFALNHPFSQEYNDLRDKALYHPASGIEIIISQTRERILTNVAILNWRNKSKPWRKCLQRER